MREIQLPSCPQTQHKKRKAVISSHVLLRQMYVTLSYMVTLLTFGIRKELVALHHDHEMWNPRREWSHHISPFCCFLRFYNAIRPIVISRLLLISFSFQSQTFHMVAPILPLFLPYCCTFHSIWVFSVVPFVPWAVEERARAMVAF